MAFKKLTDYNEDRFGGMFLLRNDKDFADVIFLYTGIDDVLVADTHYIKSSDYSGYVHCCGIGCPACEKNIRVQTKLFIPLYNIQANEIQFFDRSTRFENQLNTSVFQRIANPSQYIFRITRHGESGDVNTIYSIQPVEPNRFKSYEEILSEFNVKFPDYYSKICREYNSVELGKLLNSNPTSRPLDEDEDLSTTYNVTPRSFSTDNTDSVPMTNFTLDSVESESLDTDTIEPVSDVTF